MMEKKQYKGIIYIVCAAAAGGSFPSRRLTAVPRRKKYQSTEEIIFRKSRLTAVPRREKYPCTIICR